MKLYYAPGACSLSPHIALREAGLAFDLVRIDHGSKQTDTGIDYRTINPKGSVPALGLDDGQVLTEGPAIVQYVADRAPAKHLAPANGTLERYRLQEWLNYLCSEVHKRFGAMFAPGATDERRNDLKAQLVPKFELLARAVEGKSYLLGDSFTVADGYLFTILQWPKFVGFDLDRWPALTAYAAGIGARPAVQAALKAEGLIK